MPLDLTTFAIKWQQSQLTEKSAYQQHFRDLCEALGVPHPTEEDVAGDSYCFEKHVLKVGSDKPGYADVWKRDAFAWEYKGAGGDLKAAYRQLIEYHEPFGNPPLLIVCDLKRFEVHTKFDSQPSRVYAFTLEELRVNRPVPSSALLPQEVLRHVFDDRNLLRPSAVTEKVTRAAATDLLKLAQQLELERAAAPNPPGKEQIAHFMIRIVFCLFADSIDLMPGHVFRKLVESSRESRVNFNRKLPVLFEAMGNEGSFFGADDIPYFNGGLFEQLPQTIELNHADCEVLRRAAKHDWSQIEPSIFGTLFERSLDAAKRSMIGAHYTSPEDILLLTEPVIMAPLRRQWAQAKQTIEAALAVETGDTQRKALKANREAGLLLTEWAAGLQQVRVLDPACGSGNFLYVAMKQLLDLWQEAREFGALHKLALPVESMPTPAQLFGIEKDFYAHEIASAVVWIGLLQWKRDHGYNDRDSPVLRKLGNIEHDDAIMRYDAEGKAYEPEWPRAEFVVGNPPFLGGNKLRKEMGDSYINDLFELYADRVEPFADFVCYWFEKASEISARSSTRAGLIATQGIRGGASRKSLIRVKERGEIFLAWSDQPWVLEGAAVRISLVAFDNGSEQSKVLNGKSAALINANLTAGLDLGQAISLQENEDLCFMGASPKGPFDIGPQVAQKMLTRPLNVNYRPNRDVVRRVASGKDIVGLDRGLWTVDFGVDRTLEEAAMYEMPFDYVRKHVEPIRTLNNRKSYADRWWLYAETRPALRRALKPLARFIATPATAKHRVFVWMDAEVLLNQGAYAFAREDDYFFGVLHSRVHELWSRAQGTQLREVQSGFRYTPNSTFLTFPFPWPPGKEPSEADSPLVRAIAEAARELVKQRDAWLHPVDRDGRPVPESELKERTLTKLYNARPAWLENAHRALDRAVFAAYGWPDGLGEQEVLARLLALNHERATAKDNKERP